MNLGLNMTVECCFLSVWSMAAGGGLEWFGGWRLGRWLVTWMTSDFTVPKRCLASLNIHETMQIGHPILWKNLLAPRWTLRSGKCHLNLFLLYTVDMMREYVNWILSSAFGFQSFGCSLQLWYKIRKREGSAWIDSCNEFPSCIFPLFLNLCLFFLSFSSSGAAQQRSVYSVFNSGEILRFSTYPPWN